MACNLTRSRAEACKDSVSGIKRLYFADFGSFGTVTLTNDEVTDMTGTTIGSDSNAVVLHTYEVKGTNSFETTVNASRDNGTVFYEQTLSITLKKLTKEDHKELKLLAAARPHIIVVDQNDNLFLMGKENGADLSAGTVSTGTAMGDFNGYNLTFTAMEVSPPNFIETGGFGQVDYPLDLMAGVAGDAGVVTVGTPAAV